MSSKYSIQWGHNTFAASPISVNWPNWCCAGNTGIVYKIIIGNDKIISCILLFCNVMIEKISLRDDSVDCGISKDFGNGVESVFLCYFCCYLPKFFYFPFLCVSFYAHRRSFAPPLLEIIGLSGIFSVI